MSKGEGFSTLRFLARIRADCHHLIYKLFMYQTPEIGTRLLHFVRMLQSEAVVDLEKKNIIPRSTEHER